MRTVWRVYDWNERELVTSTDEKVKVQKMYERRGEPYGLLVTWLEIKLQNRFDLLFDPEFYFEHFRAVQRNCLRA